MACYCSPICIAAFLMAGSSPCTTLRWTIPVALLPYRTVPTKRRVGNILSIVYDADGNAWRFHWSGGQLIPAFGVWAQLHQLRDTDVRPPGVLNQKGAWLSLFTWASDG